jgi:hypothetical protein
MNERVKILWAKAAESNFGDSWEEQTAFMSKFAELIVKETLQVAKAGIQFGPSMEEAVYTYFGVEE